MNRAMRRAEQKSKRKEQTVQNSDQNLTALDQKFQISEAELASLSPTELDILSSQMAMEQMEQAKPQKKSHQGPPTGGTEGSDKPPKEPRQAYAKDIKDLTALYENIGALIALRDPLTGLIIIKSAQERATELINVAKHHKKFLELLRRIAKGGDYGACLMGHLSMIIAILAVHGRMPIEYAIPTLQKLEINPLDVLQQQEAKNGHSQDAPAPV